MLWWMLELLPVVGQNMLFREWESVLHAPSFQLICFPLMQFLVSISSVATLWTMT